ncbi:hypothetical protein D0862_14843 [Hortaea werneckii]|uniref:Ig-like domain-containing protein n=1 Tax=Hortaea werneckii TaxID=91943 RepID=A0A3M7DZT8_HORWE|nr:hypothetical protein D0862_14843 [Hortaea werneckii]
MSRLSILSSLNLLLLASLLPTTTALPRPQTDDPSPSPATTLTLTKTSTTTLCPSPTQANPTSNPSTSPTIPPIQPPSRSPGPPYQLSPAPTTTTSPIVNDPATLPSGSDSGGPPFPTNTTLTLYQGRACQYLVGRVAVSSSECQALRTEWVGVPRDATRNCTFAVWEGDDFCGSGGGGGGAEVRSVFVGSLEGVGEDGDGEVCVYVGVVQPGVYHGSGVWTCG